ncbi:MAG: hypothetical protein D6828_01435, partial [Nitrospirae bacterium]
INSIIKEIEASMIHIKEFSASIAEMGKQVHKLNMHLKELGEAISLKTSKLGTGFRSAFGGILSRGAQKKDKDKEEKDGGEGS